ncbi:MAG: hypothetical protein CMI29_08300 [Opitutae bacterium]|nr:hypothetical protein [Opitutae bacterium]|tara:strand:- start:6332 stop:6724 length:393 start_codon:yes stop_codon:yes gene_type:complete
MKRAPEDGPPVDPVLAQLDALINGTTAAAPPTKVVRTEAAVAQDPVLAQLDALINPGTGTAQAPPPIHFATPVGLVLPPPPLAPLPPLLAAGSEPEPRGPPGLLREFGGVKGYMATLRADAEDAAARTGR